MSPQLQITALDGIPLINSGDDLAVVINAALARNDLTLQSGDILVLAQKIVSKAEGRIVDLNTVNPGPEACDLAAQVDKDPRLVELILSESSAVVRAKTGVLITEHRLGWIMANAGIDASNVNGDGLVLLLPLDSDLTCRHLRAALQQHWQVDVGVIINDSFGRPWRLGTTGVALGAAGVPSLWDRCGETDLFGRELKATHQAIADELAAAASLLQGQGAEGRPVVLIRGLDLAPGIEIPAQPAATLLRDKSADLFR
ncbi:coenzyme F420-0:L-glutamate ligase [Chromatiales bacterium (ex Bugula neritina AB1)]|nr:coenzyme F420-0:L-glutamate ligase [Chromatiales bacterium (ex Bugula neritina AB1)]